MYQQHLPAHPGQCSHGQPPPTACRDPAESGGAAAERVLDGGPSGALRLPLAACQQTQSKAPANQLHPLLPPLMLSERRCLAAASQRRVLTWRSVPDPGSGPTARSSRPTPAHGCLRCGAEPAILACAHRSLAAAPACFVATCRSWVTRYLSCPCCFTQLLCPVNPCTVQFGPVKRGGGSCLDLLNQYPMAGA